MVKLHSATSRLRQLLVNTGYLSLGHAEQRLKNMTLRIHLSEDAAESPAGQAAALTAIVTGVRSFSKVSLEGAVDKSLLLRLPIRGKTIASAARHFGAKVGSAGAGARSILIGSGGETGTGIEVRAVWHGWTAGTSPGAHPLNHGRSDCTLAGAAAGALAVGQCFQAELGTPLAGKRPQAISLWTPGNGNPWSDPGPLFSAVYLPTKLWLVGLGNLGQSFLWSLALLPYSDPALLLLYLQDDDIVSEENWGTSVLVRKGHYGDLKTYNAELWCRGRGFKVRRIDRRLDEGLRRSDAEPGIALAGLDDMAPRRLLGLPGFVNVIDAGLGAEARDYHRFRINVFDNERTPAEHFAETPRELALRELRAAQRERELRALPAYKRQERTRNDGGCGMAELLGMPVAVPFVSAVAGSIAVAQSIRLSSGLAPKQTIAGSVSDIANLRTVEGKAPERVVTGSVKAAFLG